MVCETIFFQVSTLGNVIAKVITGDSDAGDSGEEDEGGNGNNRGSHLGGAVVSGSSGATVPRVSAGAAGGTGKGATPQPGPPAPPHARWANSVPQSIPAAVAHKQQARTPPNHPHVGILHGYVPSPPLSSVQISPSLVSTTPLCGGSDDMADRRRFVRELLSKPGCVTHEDDMMTCTSREISEVGYLLRMYVPPPHPPYPLPSENLQQLWDVPQIRAKNLHLKHRERRKWKLRNIQGLSPEKYVKFALSPLHYACASGDPECITLLLQQGCIATESAFYGSKSLTCLEMLDGSEYVFCSAHSPPRCGGGVHLCLVKFTHNRLPRSYLQRVFMFWQSHDCMWTPATHELFPAEVRRHARLLYYCNAQRGSARRYVGFVLFCIYFFFAILEGPLTVQRKSLLLYCRRVAYLTPSSAVVVWPAVHFRVSPKRRLGVGGFFLSQRGPRSLPLAEGVCVCGTHSGSTPSGMAARWRSNLSNFRRGSRCAPAPPKGQACWSALEKFSRRSTYGSDRKIRLARYR